MMTTHEPTVLLLDLGERNAEFTQALAQVGRPAVAITVAQLAEAFSNLAPMCVVTHREHVAAVAEQIKLLGRLRPLPFFVLAKDQPGSMRPPSPEVTACVPEGIEAGILALRIQQALQEAGGPRPRQTTVLGLGNFSRPQVLPTSTTPSFPSAPALPPASSLAVPSTPPPAPSLPPSQAMAPSVPPRAPSVPPAAPAVPPPAALPSAPPIASAPPAASVPPSAVAPSVPPSLEDPVPTNAPVAISQSGVISGADSLAPKGSRRSLLPKLLAVAGVVGVLGAGGFMAWKSSSNAAQAETHAAPDASKDSDKSSVAAPAAAKPAPGGPATKASGEDAKASGEATKSPSEAVPAAPPPPEAANTKASGESSYFKIPTPESATKCEEALGKSESDFAAAKTWQASQAWKLARRSLMAGKEEDALKHMCESAFIDPAGPATSGLVKYYLGKRALDEAHTWAKRGVEAATSASSKRAAQQMLGDVLSQLGQVDEAKAIWLESFNLTADQTDRLAPVCRNFLNAALKSRKGGDSPLAEQLLRRAATFSPEDATVAAVLASTLLDNAQPALAELWAKRALELKPNLEMAEGVLSQLKK